MAAGLQAHGVAPGTHVAILGPTTRALVTAIEATWLAGAAAVMLPLPMRLASIDDFVRQTRARIRASDAVAARHRPATRAVHRARAGRPAGRRPRRAATRRRPTPTASPTCVPADDPDALAILQYTSGSTSDPKGVMLPHRCVTANLDGIVAAAGLDRDDVGVSWLPLYHDMGLIGLLATPMTTGMDLALAAPQDFLAAPARWMEWMDAFGGTATAGPNFSYVLAGRALRRLQGLDLRRWSLALNGAEPVDPASVEAFAAAGAPHGLAPGRDLPRVRHGRGDARRDVPRRRAAASWSTPSTGGCSKATSTPRRSRPTTTPRASSRQARTAGPRACRCACATAARGTAMREREVGEIEIRGSSVTPGYYRHPEGDRRRVPPRLAAHRRPRLPRRRRARRLRPDQGRHHPRRPQRVPAGRRARGRRRHRRARRQRDRVRHGGQARTRVARRRGREQGRRARRAFAPR